MAQTPNTLDPIIPKMQLDSVCHRVTRWLLLLSWYGLFFDGQGVVCFGVPISVFSTISSVLLYIKTQDSMKNGTITYVHFIT